MWAYLQFNTTTIIPVLSFPCWLSKTECPNCLALRKKLAFGLGPGTLGWFWRLITTAIVYIDLCIKDNKSLLMSLWYITWDLQIIFIANFSVLNHQNCSCCSRLILCCAYHWFAEYVLMLLSIYLWKKNIYRPFGKKSNQLMSHIFMRVRRLTCPYLAY